MIVHYEILDKLIHHPRWNLKTIPHEAARGHLGYGDIHISLLALHKPKRILMVGSQYGFILAVLGLMAKSYGGQVDFVDANFDEKIIGPDAYAGHGYWTEYNQREFVRDFDLAATVRFHIMTTQQFFAGHRDGYQYAYLDGDHSYDGVCYDFEHCLSRCDAGSFITLHDAKVEDGWHGFRFGVSQMLKEIRQPHIIVGNFPGLAIVSL